jgi:hypothetical protein
MKFSTLRMSRASLPVSACLSLAALMISAAPHAFAEDAKPTKEVHIVSKGEIRPGTRSAAAIPALKASPKLTPVNTGSGVVFTCDPNIDSTVAGTCNYLNTVVSGNVNGTFTNANASFYVVYGPTGLGSSTSYGNSITYNQYIGGLSANTNKSAAQSAALTALNTYAAPLYGGGNVQIQGALAQALGFPGKTGITWPAEASCTLGNSGCYNVIITIADAATQAQEGISLYYDQNGGTPGPDSYDIYAVIAHEANEGLGSSSCVSTGGSLKACGSPNAADLYRYSSAGTLAPVTTAPSTTPGQYFSYDGGSTNPLKGTGGQPIFYNTLANGEDYGDYTSSSPCAANAAIQTAESCPGLKGLTILNDGGSEITTLNVVGYDVPAPVAPVTLSASSLSFGSVAVGASSSSQTVTLTNNSSSAVTFSSIAVTGTNASSFIFANSCGTSLAAGANCTIHGHFTPSTTGALTASITITDSASNSPQTVSLTGTGGAAATVSFSTSTLAFSSTKVGLSSASLSATLTNTGSATLIISGTAITGANASSFVLLSNCTGHIAAGASCTVHGHFSPTATGPLTAAFTVTDNAANSPQSIALTGSGK